MGIPARREAGGDAEEMPGGLGSQRRPRSGLHDGVEGAWGALGPLRGLFTRVSALCLKRPWTSAPSTTARRACMTATFPSGPSASTRAAPPTPAPVCQASLGTAGPAKVRVAPIVLCAT